MHYDLIVIGGGPGGYAAAVHASKHGMNVALVEKDRLGGTCLQRGCVPTKAYLHATESALAALTFAPRAVAEFDRRAMWQHKNEMVEQLTQGLHQLMKTHKIAVLEGLGTLLSQKAPFTVRVAKDGESERFTADKVLLATGGRPARLPLPGCNDPSLWTSDDLLGEKGTRDFSSLLIVGGGVIGVEMACIYARLGVLVTIVEAEKSCLPMMDRELGRSAEIMLKAMGVAVLTDARLQVVAKEKGSFVVTVEKDGMQSIPCDRVLLATGRKPVTQGLFAEDMEPEMDRGAVKVNPSFETSIPGVYAIGDMNGLCALAHAAHAQGLAAVSHMLGLEAPINTALVPSCVYTVPEIASVGLTQEEAKKRGMEVSVGKVLTTQNARSLIEGLGRGFVKLVVDKNTKQVLGAQLFCGRATDLLGELTLAIQRGLSATELLRPLRAHPTFYEAVTEAVEAAMK